MTKNTGLTQIERLRLYVEHDLSEPCFDSLMDEIKTLRAQRDALKAALCKIESRPDKMIWGEDYEITEAMRDMEEIARKALETFRALSEQ